MAWRGKEGSDGGGRNVVMSGTLSSPSLLSVTRNGQTRLRISSGISGGGPPANPRRETSEKSSGSVDENGKIISGRRRRRAGLARERSWSAIFSGFELRMI